jgi:hypothetical protein
MSPENLCDRQTSWRTFHPAPTGVRVVYAECRRWREAHEDRTAPAGRDNVAVAIETFTEVSGNADASDHQRHLRSIGQQHR